MNFKTLKIGVEHIMNKYQRGKIYEIIAPDGQKYIGSTISSLADRLGNHRRLYRSWKNGTQRYTTVFDLFEIHGMENCNIQLIELFPCNSKKELERREGEIIKQNNCINKVVAGRTSEEYRKDNETLLKQKFKKFYEENKQAEIERTARWTNENPERVRLNRTKYYQNNKEVIKEKKRLYREKNIEKIREYKRLYREKNRDKINQQKRESRLRNNSK